VPATGGHRDSERSGVMVDLATLAEVLACPECADRLRPEAAPAGYECIGCARRYPVIGEVPVLLRDRHAADVQRAFSAQWQLRREGRFEAAGEVYHAPHDARADVYEQRLRPVLETAAPGSWIVDAGCGSGELIAVLAGRYPHLRFIGLDFTDSVFAAASAARAHRNLIYLQADVSRAPFRAGSVLAAASFGVLHHTPDTRTAFSSLAGCIAEDGMLSIWLYPNPGDLHLAERRVRLAYRAYYATRDYLFLGRGHRLRPSLLLWLLRLLLAPVLLLPTGRVTQHSDGSRSRTYHSLVFAMFDGLAPAYQHRPPRRDVVDWYRACGFSRIVAGPVSDRIPHTLGSFSGRRCVAERV
ncbi:MAG: methyltransferase domain-containing protein, partial [Pseudomonadales bacterium]